MNDPVFTRCPGCGTVFRVSPAQLALREGQVRCGHCRAVFDANDQRVTLGAPHVDEFEPPDELAAGRPTVTLRNADALQPVVTPPSVPATAEPQADAGGEASVQVEADSVRQSAPPVKADEPEDAPSPPERDGALERPASADAETTTPDAPAVAEPKETAATVEDVGLRAARFEWKPRKPLRERPRTLYGYALAALVIALGVQAVVEYRDALAAHAPFTRPILEGACTLFGCTIGPLRDAAAISIDASDLQADPAHRGLLKLSATIRNRAAYPIAWPYLELTLTDASDSVVARRAFAPGEYVGIGRDAARGIPGNGENVITLFLDASETSQAGYRLYLFYP